MPSRYEPRPQPYGYSSYQGGDRILDLIMRQGEIQAQGAQRGSEIWGQALSGIGQTLAGGIQQHQEQQAESRRSQAFAAAMESGDPRAIISVLGPRDGPAVVTALRAHTPDGLKSYTNRMEVLRDQARGIRAVPPEQRAQAFAFARNGMISAGVLKPEELPEAYEEAQPFIDQAANYGQEPAKAQGLTAVAPNNTLYDPANREAVFTAPAAPAAPAQPRVVGRSLVRDDGSVIYRDPAEPRSGGDTEPLMAVIDPTTGRPVYRRRREAEGLAPASSREQGRPVTSGDASRVAELDTSLDDLAVLRRTVTGSNATGTSARVGASLPNFVTEATGWGADAKSKQAVIDRVKQVIGKALEGGVLRKEDESKYEKILPTISDVPEVVEAKMAGLERAIALRRQRQLESMGDAGYDTARFTERPARPIPPGATPGAGPAAGGAPPVPIVQRDTATGAYRHSLDGGRTWKAGQP